jgi:FlaA1/EpsC-like NDP-sugar epimerase
VRIGKIRTGKQGLRNYKKRELRLEIFMHYALIWATSYCLYAHLLVLAPMSYPNVTPESVMEQETIRAAMEMAKPTVCVIGAGGAGSNIVSWIKTKGISGGKLIAVNTDAARLGITKADRRILIGPKLTQGQGLRWLS